MPQQQASSIENSFIGGLKTEFTGLNFPENACTDVDNCVFSLVGDVLRREGIDFEDNADFKQISISSSAICSYKWTNVGGDGSTQILVVQVGNLLYFYKSSSATAAAPLSTTILSSTVTLTDFHAAGNTNFPGETECQFTDGNGYLFVYHPDLEPFYCTYNAGTITGNKIILQVRDFNGIPEPGVATNFRPASMTAEHTYNLFNQGWNSGNPWSATSTTSNVLSIGSKTFTVASGLAATNGQQVSIHTNQLPPDPDIVLGFATVTSYSGTTLVININNALSTQVGVSFTQWTFIPINIGLTDTWFTDVGNYPSNADVWWNFKDTTNNFDPSTTFSNVTLNSGPAPHGYFILDAFRQERTFASGVSGLTAINTATRPKTGAWFQGRVWYAGVDSSFAPSGDEPYYTWTENIYFSQIATTTAQFGMCYQNNDPTSEDLFDLLPTDGGVISIQGAGSIDKLFPIQNGMLVFAANGIWFITGSQGIGFSANDYTITKISSVQSISGTSHVDVLGFPVFWNEEGIYSVTPSKQGGGLTVDNICLGTILSFYADIPTISKKYARGDYNPLTFVLSWAYRSTNESTIDNRYQYDKILHLNTANKAFYPYTIDTTLAHINDVKYISSPGGSTAPLPTLKYLTSFISLVDSLNYFTFSEEKDSTNWVDYFSLNNGGINYISYFVTGYKLHGQALRKWQPEYIYVFSKTDVPTGYTIQGIWDYANTRNSGKYSTPQLGTSNFTNFGMMYRRFKIRGRGLSLQLKVNSIDGKPFNIMGWSIYETSNAGVG